MSERWYGPAWRKIGRTNRKDWLGEDRGKPPNPQISDMEPMLSYFVSNLSIEEGLGTISWMRGGTGGRTRTSCLTRVDDTAVGIGEADPRSVTDSRDELHTARESSSRVDKDSTRRTDHDIEPTTPLISSHYLLNEGWAHLGLVWIALPVY